MSDHKHIEVVIVADTQLGCIPPVEANGWGPDAQQAMVSGTVTEINIHRNNKTEVIISVMPDGSLILSQMESQYSIRLGGENRLTNERPWKD
jgi:hypothetical protein